MWIKPGPTLTGQSGDILSVVWSPNGRFLAVGLQDGSIYIWDVTQETLLYTLYYSAYDYIADLTSSPDGQTLATASCLSEPVSNDSCALIIWNPPQGEYIGAL